VVVDRLQIFRTLPPNCAIRVGICTVVITLLLSFDPANAASSLAAGLQITNVAAVQFDDVRGEHTQSSNSVSTVVDAVLDVTVAAVSPGVTSGKGYLDQTLWFVLTNTGNGPETFDLPRTRLCPTRVSIRCSSALSSTRITTVN